MGQRGEDLGADNVIKADDPVTVAQYMKEKNLQD